MVIPRIRCMLRRALTIVFLGSFLADCASSAVRLQSPAPDKRIILGSATSVCQPETTFTQWYLLFGAIPLNRVNVAFADPKKTYRVSEESTNTDILIDIVGGALLTATRRTITLHSCQETFVLESPEQKAEARKAEIRAALDQYMSSHKAAHGPIFLMNSGETHSGKIVEISDTEITIEESKEVKDAEKTDKVDSKEEEKIDQVFMRDGTLFEGHIVAQTATNVSLLTKNKGTLLLPKTGIRRISYRKASADKTDKDKKEPEKKVERVILLRSDIKRIVLSADEAAAQ